MKFELVALDIDGTLLDEKSELTQGTIETVKAVQDRGIKVVLATGRRIVTSLQVAKALDINLPLIAHNGALIFEFGSKNIIYNKTFTGEKILPLLEFEELNSLDFFYHCGEDIFLFKEPNLGWGLKYLTESTGYINIAEPDILAAEKDIHRLVVSGEEELVKEYQQKIENNSADFRCIIFRSKLFDLSVLEVLHSNASKGNALQYLADLWQVPAEKVLAVGDDSNDLEMIEWAGLGVAMGNAVSSLKDCADLVCGDNSRQGIVALLEDYVL